MISWDIMGYHGILMEFDGTLVNSNKFHPFYWIVPSGCRGFFPATGTPSKCGSEERRGGMEVRVGRTGGVAF